MRPNYDFRLFYHTEAGGGGFFHYPCNETNLTAQSEFNPGDRVPILPANQQRKELAIA